MTIYKRNCNTCGKYYEGGGKKYCSHKCAPSPMKGKRMQKLSDGTFYSHIPTICYCMQPSCYQTCWHGNYIHGHNTRIDSYIKGKHRSEESIRKQAITNTKTFLLDEHGNKEIYPFIPTLCECGCNEIIWDPRTTIKRGHISRMKPPIENLKLGWELNQTEEHKEYLSSVLSGKPGWNKGLTKETDERVKKSGEKISESNTGNERPQCRGENHFAWNGGSSFLPYCDKFNDKLKRKIRLRDSHICQLCGKTQEQQLYELNRILSVHHIHYDKKNCEPDLITLCCSCNIKVNSNRSYYESFFMNKLNDRQLLFWIKWRKD